MSPFLKSLVFSEKPSTCDLGAFSSQDLDEANLLENNDLDTLLDVYCNRRSITDQQIITLAQNENNNN
ncbi:32963_t:CDS:2 [Gigaspora margarita]|uniref:32963_t:CDS:1 n=1 Tax=Gigaspora margarita TaxID=4874 RepID=A0ABM8VX47_GIGMA|nr:32963_t:CDS:2 [Gigaspora margarita]